MSDSLSIREFEGDLLEQTTISWAHCVSANLKMGMGIARQIRNAIGRVNELREQMCGVGEVAVLEDGDRFIFYLITKHMHWDKPTREDFERCLVALRMLCERNRVEVLGIPQLGCGLDRLDWSWVVGAIERAFDGCPIEIRVYTLPGTRAGHTVTVNRSGLSSKNAKGPGRLCIRTDPAD